jgi:hypothetical protein
MLTMHYIYTDNDILLLYKLNTCFVWWKYTIVHIVKMYKCQKYLFINVWRKSVFHIYFTEIGAALTTVLPVLFKYCYKYCYSDSRKLWAVMKGEGLAL